MGRRLALMIGAAMLAATPVATRAQTPDPTYQAGQPPPDMPPADGARMAELETQALAAIEAGDWAAVERLIREGLVLEQRHYAADDARIGHSWDWLARAAQEQGRPPGDVIPLLEARLAIAEAHPEDPSTLAAARYALGVQLMAGERPGEAVPLMRAAGDWLAEQGPEQAASLRTVRTALGRALAASGDKTQAVGVWAPLLADFPEDGDADGRAGLAWALAVALIDLDRHAEAEGPLRIATARYRDAGQPRDEALTTYWLADVLRRTERAAEADALMLRVVELEAATPGGERTLSVDQMRSTLLPLGDRLRGEGRQDEAAAVYALLIEANRTRPDEKGHLAAALSRLGLSRYRSERYAEAMTAQQEALDIWRELRTAPHVDIANQLEQLGQSQLSGDRHLEALRSLSEAATMRVDLGEEPSVTLLMNHAEAAELTGRLEASLALRQRVIERLSAETPQRPEALASAWGDIGHAAHLLERPVEAEAFYRRGLALASGPNLRERLTTGLAFALTEQGRGDEGEPLQRQVLADAAARTGPTSTTTALAMNSLANMLSRRGDHLRAEPLVRDALVILEAEEEPDRARIATLKLNLGVILSDQGRHNEAVRLLAEAFTARRTLFGAGHPSTVSVVNLLAHEFVEVGAYDRAEPLFTQMVALRETQLGPDHPAVADALQNQAYVLESTGRHAEAAALMQRAVEIIEAASQDPRERIRFNANWGVSLMNAGRAGEAVEVLRRARTLMVDRRRAAGDPSWSRAESDAFRFLFRNSVQAAWAASNESAP